MKLSSEGAVLRIDNVDVILTAKRTAFTTLDDFKAYGINPLERKIIIGITASVAKKTSRGSLFYRLFIPDQESKEGVD
jgi:hypothetical protein